MAFYPDFYNFIPFLGYLYFFIFKNENKKNAKMKIWEKRKKMYKCKKSYNINKI